MICDACGWDGWDGRARHVRGGPLEGFTDDDVPDELFCGAGGRDGVRCSHCARPGHTRRECPRIGGASPTPEQLRARDEEAVLAAVAAGTQSLREAARDVNVSMAMARIIRARLVAAGRLPRGALSERPRRGTKPRARTLVATRLTADECERGSHLVDTVDDGDRPQTRGDCRDAPRPCPWVRCAHHLYADVTEAGGLKLNFPHLEVWEMRETCSLDVADRGGGTLDEVGEILNITRERARQIEVKALVNLRAAAAHLEDPDARGDPAGLGGAARRRVVDREERDAPEGDGDGAGEAA